MRKTRSEHMLSALLPLATEERTFGIGSFVPGSDERSAAARARPFSASTFSAPGPLLPARLSGISIHRRPALGGYGGFGAGIRRRGVRRCRLDIDHATRTESRCCRSDNETRRRPRVRRHWISPRVEEPLRRSTYVAAFRSVAARARPLQHGACISRRANTS